jgi:predicted phage baseplate assembly protein
MTASLTGSPRRNRPGLPEIRTRIGTHGAFLAAMLDRIRTRTQPGLAGLHTRASDDPAIALCDAWASIADVLTFYQERIANEGYLRTAVERRSVAEIARLVGYRMRPGVAASAHLAFTTEANETAVLPAGVRVQTVPDGEEPARRFELVETLEARSDLNQLKVHATEAPAPDPDLTQFFAAGVASTVKPGDAVVLVADDHPVMRRVTEVASQFVSERTLIRLAPPAPPAGTPVAEGGAIREAPAEQPLSLADLADEIREELAQVAVRPPRVASLLHQDVMSLLKPDTDIAMRLRGSSVRDGDTDNLYAALGAVRETGTGRLEVHAMRLSTSPFGASAPPRMEAGRHATTDWPLAEDSSVLFIEAIANDILPGSWVAFEAPPGQPVPPPRRVVAASVVGRVAYGLATRCTRLQLDGPWIDSAATFEHLRKLTVYAGSTPVVLARNDVTEPIGKTREIELDQVIGEIAPGRWMIVEGELFDRPGARMSEVVMLESSRHVLPVQGSGDRGVRTVLRLANELAYRYRRDSVIIWGNVARATEGETFSEVLGSGDGTRVGQGFVLARAPLTYVSSPTVNGGASTLQVVVNGVIWQEVDNLALAGPNDRVFVIEPAGVAPPVIRFGNGTNGARLPTGVENVVAHYRVGLGVDGNCYPGQISQLLTRPAGVRSVVNPRPASGGADPESRDDARRNAAAGVTALGRLVGVQDFADFARSFAGVGKADATLVHRNGEPTVLVTIAGQDDTPIQPDADLLHSLADALQRWGDTSQAVIVLPARNVRVVLSAHVGLAEGHVWEWVQPRLRVMLLDRFGYSLRQLGRNLYRSEVLQAMHEVPGVADVDLDMLSRLPDPVTSDILVTVARTGAVNDVRVRSGRLAITAQGREPRGAELAFLWRDMPELIVLSVIAS